MSSDDKVAIKVFQADGTLKDVEYDKDHKLAKVSSIICKETLDDNDMDVLIDTQRDMYEDISKEDEEELKGGYQKAHAILRHPGFITIIRNHMENMEANTAVNVLKATATSALQFMDEYPEFESEVLRNSYESMLSKPESELEGFTANMIIPSKTKSHL